MRSLVLTMILLFAANAAADSWIFHRSTYTHRDGVRVAQHDRLPRVEPLDDERRVTYRRHHSWTFQRGTNGSIDVTYERQEW
jgi:hypothetical protein